MFNLTEFEYFKAGFADLITDANQRNRFETNMDGKWMDAIWSVVSASDEVGEGEDIALTVDNAFLNLFNYITSVIAFITSPVVYPGLGFTII